MGSSTRQFVLAEASEAAMRGRVASLTDELKREFVARFAREYQVETRSSGVHVPQGVGVEARALLVRSGWRKGAVLQVSWDRKDRTHVRIDWAPSPRIDDYIIYGSLVPPMAGAALYALFAGARASGVGSALVVGGVAGGVIAIVLFGLNQLLFLRSTSAGNRALATQLCEEAARRLEA